MTRESASSFIAETPSFAPACRASVVISTKNRKEELRNAVASAVAQSGGAEVLVIDDGSTDGTPDMIRAEFPTVRLERHENSAGYIVRRNEGARLAGGDIIFSIDDDATFPNPHTIEKTLAEFDNPRVGAVAIPFINVRLDDILRQHATENRIQAGVSYIGTAHAVRRDVFLALHGYREGLVHQGEESDFCLRMLAAGYVVRFGTAEPIHHFESPRRDFRRMDYYGRRNDILYAWQNVPMPYMPVHMLASTIKGVTYGARSGRLGAMIKGLAGGYAACARQWSLRQPVPAEIYRLSRELKKRGRVPLAEIEHRLPPTMPVTAASLQSIR